MVDELVTPRGKGAKEGAEAVVAELDVGWPHPRRGLEAVRGERAPGRAALLQPDVLGPLVQVHGEPNRNDRAHLQPAGERVAGQRLRLPAHAQLAAIRLQHILTL